MALGTGDYFGEEKLYSGLLHYYFIVILRSLFNSVSIISVIIRHSRGHPTRYVWAKLRRKVKLLQLARNGIKKGLWDENSIFYNHMFKVF